MGHFLAILFLLIGAVAAVKTDHANATGVNGTFTGTGNRFTPEPMRLKDQLPKANSTGEIEAEKDIEKIKENLRQMVKDAFHLGMWQSMIYFEDTYNNVIQLLDNFKSKKDAVKSMMRQNDFSSQENLTTAFTMLEKQAAGLFERLKSASLSSDRKKRGGYELNCATLPPHRGYDTFDVPTRGLHSEDSTINNNIKGPFSSRPGTLETPKSSSPNSDRKKRERYGQNITYDEPLNNSYMHDFGNGIPLHSLHSDDSKANRNNTIGKGPFSQLIVDRPANPIKAENGTIKTGSSNGKSSPVTRSPSTGPTEDRINTNKTGRNG
uniref:DUF148 domain-containing protein n=1 Tax=Caenorhabditis tropicalis TaxID=1561998 RepID=A0A1I7TRA3_9PELO